MSGLWHFTCGHGRLALGRSAKLLPLGQLLGARVTRLPKWSEALADMIWLTDMDVPIAEALGLTMQTTACDRTQHRYRVVNYNAIHYPAIRRDLPKPLRTSLESAEGAMPMHWWIAYTPVPVVYAPLVAAGEVARDG